MRVGDWVTFQTVVVKQRYATGSSPATHTLARTRRGMVIGEQQVYDAMVGMPPVLTNRRRVLLVAVSLHRSYRVYPSDVQPSAPPRKRHSRFLPPPAHVVSRSSPAAQHAPANRLHISTIAMMVADEIKQRVDSDLSFTCCAVTQALRDARPGVIIPHEDVFQTLGAQMDPLVLAGCYQRSAVAGSYADVCYTYVGGGA